MARRRLLIIEATLLLLLQHGTTVSTSKIAQAAGIAEGTVFRAFKDKDELIGACVLAALRPDVPIAATGSIVGLVAAQRIYGRETTGFIDQAVAQDVVNLAVVAPLIVVLGIRARRGSVRAYTCWLGCLAFTAYSYAIYAFSIHFGSLFLAWLAVLGLSFYALLGSLTTVDTAVVARWFGNRAMPVTGWTLIIAAAAFGLLWLSGIVPDLLAGRASASAAALNLPTNPVHVLDLALFLPAVLASGTLLLRRQPLGYVTAPGVLTFLILTCLPVLVTPLMSLANGRDPAWGALAPLALVSVATTGILYRTLRRPGSE